MSALDKTGLEPCPFCGGKDLVSEGDDKIVGYRCRTCEATGPNHYDSRFDWNRRASITSAGVTEEQVDHALDAADYCRNTITRKWMRAALEAAFVSRVAPVSQKEAVPVAAKYPLATFGDPDVLPLGLFRIHWASGGSSLAAVGMMENGDRWIAPTNWISPCLDPTNEFAWGGIERAEPIPAPAPAVEPVGIKADDRLFNADEPMADGEIEMTAAENVLAWLIIEKIGVPDDRGYSPNEAQEILVRRLDYANELENESLRSALHPTPTPVSAPVGVVEALRKASVTVKRYIRAGYGDDVFMSDLCETDRAIDAALRSPPVGESEIIALLREVRTWIGDGANADDLGREIWTDAYADIIDRVDDVLARSPAAEGKPGGGL